MRRQRPFPPYSTKAELARGKRKTIVTMLLAVAAAVLAAVARSVVDDQRLTTLYVAAAVLWILSGIGEAVRWSNTRELEHAD